jgi:hypothetical protein
VLATVLLTMLCLPCAVAVVVCADELVGRRLWSRRSRRERQALVCLDRSLATGELDLRLPERELAIDELVADLRRLDRQRRSSPTTESVLWLAAVLRAYDQRLALASRSLGLIEHLDQLDGMDREIERVRVEGLLLAAGLRLRTA